MENDGDLKNQFFINRNFITALMFYARFMTLKIINVGVYLCQDTIEKYLVCQY